MATQSVSLQPGESKVVSFEAIPTVAKTYQVLVNGLTGSFRAVSPVVPIYSVVLGVSNTTPKVGEAISWWVDITNIGTVSGEPRIEWYIDGVTPGHSHIPPLAPGASRRVYGVNVSFSTSGTHTLGVKVGSGDGEIVDGVIAEINIEVIGVTPPPSNYLLMTKSELYSYLINGSVARDWWGILDSDRRSLARKIIEWWSYPIRAYVCDKGGSGCLIPPSNDPYTNPSGSQMSCECYCEASLRFLRLGSKEGCPTNRYYWEQLEDKWKCVCPDYDFKLPIVIVGVSKGTFGHWICGIQVGTDQMVFGSWIFFNLDEIVAPGNPRQMPSGSAIRLYDVIGIDSWGMVELTTGAGFVTFTV